MTETPFGEFIESLALPHVDSGEHARLWNEWMAAYPDRSPIEQGLIDQAVDALIARRRLARIRAAVQAEKVRTAVLCWERAEEDMVARHVLHFNVHAPSALVGLLRSAAGCRWAIAYWEKLARGLAEDGTWFGIDRIMVIQLRGLSACLDELYHSEEAWTIWIDCLAAQPNPKPRDIELIVDRANVPKAFQDRDLPLWPRDAAECRARLQAIVDLELPRLRALEASLRVQYEDPARAAARPMALASVTKDEMQLLRAERIHEQSFLQASTALVKFRKQTAASRVPAADRPLDELRLIPRRSVTVPRVPDPAPPAGDGPVVGRPEHRRVSGESGGTNREPINVVEHKGCKEPKL